MSVNSARPHLLVIPEDDANRQITNGFVLDLNCNERAIQVLKPAKGWLKVLETFKTDFLPGMRQYPERRIVLLMDFDGKPAERKSFIEKNIPEDVKNRVFVLGAFSDPENIRSACGKKLEKIGATLAKDCAENKKDFWRHDLLEHNASELDRLFEDVRPFLFPAKG